MKILLIEDEIKIANAIKRGLNEEKFVVEVYNDGQEGLEASLYDDSFDLMIIDRMLPKVEGVAIVQKVRENKIKTPILILTAKGEVQNKVEGLNAGADDYLVKPFSFEELLARIKALLRRPKEITKEILELQDLSLNLKSCEVKRQNVLILLTAMEFKLLTYLIQNKNQVLSKSKIIEHIWTFDDDIFDNTVEVYIANLRRKCEKPFKGSKLITTIKGLGYKAEG